MRRIGEVILDLVKNKAGFDHADANLKEIAALTTPVPVEVEEALNRLMNDKEAAAWALGNMEVKNKFMAQAYNGWDKKLLDSAEKFGFTEEEADKLRNEKSSGKKQDLFNEMLASRLESAAQAGKNPGKKSEAEEAAQKWEAEYKRVVAEMTKKDADFQNKLSEKDQHVYNFKMNAKIENVLSSLAWSDNISAELRGDVARVAINKYFEKEKIKPMLDDKDEIILMRSEDTSMPYFDSSNKTPKFTELVKKIASENKLLAVSAPTPPNTPQIPAAPITGQPNTPKRSNSIQSLIKNSLQDQGIQ